MTVSRPILRYHGGKWLLAPWIISHFPSHRIYTEVYGGGGSVLLRKKRCYAEVYNDKWGLVVNVFQVMRDPELSARLKELLELTPFSRDEFNGCNEQIFKIKDPVEKARRTIFRSFAGFGSAATNANYQTGFRANSSRYGTTPAQDWVNYPKNIEAFVERLKGVIIENKNAIDILKQHDSEETLHYVDPPYVHATRNIKRKNFAYEFEMTDEDHIKLSEVLNGLKGMVIVSGYPSDLYDELYKDWAIVRREALADGAAKRTEVLWMNDNCVNNQIQMSLF